MANLSFNPTRIKHPTFQSHRPVSYIASFSKTQLYFPTKLSKNRPKTLHFQPCSVSESSVQLPMEDQTLDEPDDPTAELSYLDPETDPESITEWELDFCSRPMLDIRGKKVWELLVCDGSLSLQYNKYFPNNVINSITLKDAIVSVCDQLGVPLPDKIRFFRSQMQTIITKACKELGSKPVPSKRVRIIYLNT